MSRHKRRKTGEKTERVRVIILSIPTVVKMLGGEAMRQSKKAALMHPANLVTWKIKQGGTLSL